MKENNGAAVAKGLAQTGARVTQAKPQEARPDRSRKAKCPPKQFLRCFRRLQAPDANAKRASIVGQSTGRLIDAQKQRARPLRA